MSFARRVTHSTTLALVLWCLVLWLLDALDITWSRPTLFGAALFCGFGLWLEHRASNPPREKLGARPGEKLGLQPVAEALICSNLVAIFSLATFLGWNVMSDYVFHWGLKAKHFALAGGLDYEFLAQPWNAHTHPDYPNLVPTLYASSFIWTGEHSWWTVAWLPVVGFVLLLLACRELAGRVIPSAIESVLAMTLVGCACLSFAVGPMIAGGADFLIAFAITMGVAILARPLDAVSDREVAWIAALAAAGKIEGIVVAASLIALHLGRRFAQRPTLSQGLATFVRSLWPSAIVIAFWLGSVLAHGLFLESNTGGLDPARLQTVLAGLAAALVDPRWHGLPFVLPALPLLLLIRSDLRLAATLPALQGLFYLYAYLSGPVDTELWIQTSASRLFFHLLPAVTLLGIGWWVRAPETDSTHEVELFSVVPE